MQNPPPPSQKQAAEAQQARYAAEVAILALFVAVETGGGDGEDDFSALQEIQIIAILAALSAAIVFTSFRDPRDRSNSLLLVKPDHERLSQEVLPNAKRAFKELSEAELTDEQKSVLWATWAYSMVADEIANAVNRGDIPHQFSEQGLTLKKVWISRSDQRVRPLHAKLHGKTIPSSGDFWRWPHTGQRLRWPGDREAPPEATIGCRCVVILTWADQAGVSETIRKITEHTRPNH